ncbi:MAG: PP2C family protein-serine/threonine phosphatase [Terracidiphilus sp.]
MLPRMAGKTFLQIFALAAISLTLAHAAVPGATEPAVPMLNLDGLGKGTAKLDGPWQFKTGDDLGWAAPGLDDSKWEQIRADATWGAQTHPNYTGFAWYRRHIHVTTAPGASPDLALYLPPVQDACEIYWNGVLVARFGAVPPNPTWYYLPPPQTYGLGPVRDGVLAFRMWKAPPVSFDSGDLGGFSALPIAGSPEAIAALKAVSDYRWMRSRQFTWAVDFLSLMVVVLALFTWLRDRTQWVLFWIAGFFLGPLAVTLFLTLRIPWSFNFAIGVAQPFFGITDVSLWFVLIWMLDLHENQQLVRFARFIAILNIVVTSIDGMLSIPVGASNWVAQVELADAICTAIFTTCESFALVLVVYAVVQRKRLELSRWLVAIFAFTWDMINVVRIAFEQGRRFTHWTFADKIAAPLFTFNGNAINASSIAQVLLLISLVYAVYRYVAEDRRRQAALEQEFKNAREVQQVLVPEELPSMPGFAVTSAYRPAQQVGGDFFQIIPLEGGSTLVLLGDVSGKGLRAAMAVSLIVGAARMIADYTTSPAEILAGLNRRLCGRLQGGFATCIAMRLDRDGNCAVSSAGHPAPFLNMHEMNLPGALPLGIQPSATYEETVVRVGVGDHFALYTDGLLEARNQTGELYSFARLESLFAGKPNAAEATLAAVNFGQDDDITVLTLTRLAVSEESTAQHMASSL